LQRFKNTEVLLSAIGEGVASLLWRQDTFAYADGWDTERSRYLGLKAGQQITVHVNNDGVLVKPDVAAAQLAADAVPVAPAAANQQAASMQATTLTDVEMKEKYQPVIVEPQLWARPK